MAESPTKLTLRHLRDQGYICQVVEVWNPHARIRQDLFGVVDVLALRGTETLAVQTTSASHVADRVRKIAESEHIDAIREAGWRFLVHGWAKVGNRWTLTREVDVS